jgi:hypothetical protein
MEEAIKLGTSETTWDVCLELASSSLHIYPRWPRSAPVLELISPMRYISPPNATWAYSIGTSCFALLTAQTLVTKFYTFVFGNIQ